MSNSEVKAEKQQDEGWGNRPVAVGHCARENDREMKPNSRQQFLSVIQLLVPFSETRVRRSLRFQATDAPLFSWWIPQGFVRRPQV